MKQGDQIQERYELEESLGKGGMAEVWRALDHNLERPVAIKVLAPQLTADPEFLVRFFSEAQSVARLSHPNVVSVLDFGEHDGSPYLVMEYVPRGAVTELTGEPVQEERAAEIVRDAARGAGAAHEIGIVHRDIKPANILLCEDGRAEIADFGIALTAFSEKLTATGQVIGSPHYIAPEQAAGKGAQPESDVYALGVVLYELLTGRPPFDADNATAIAIAHVDREPDPPSQYVPEIDPALEGLVLQTLAKDPAQRFPNGDALADAIEDVVPALGKTSSGRSAAAYVPAAAAAAAAGTSVDTAPRKVVHEDPYATTGARRVVGIAVALLILIGMGAGAWAMLRNNEPPDSVASASESDRDGKRPKPRSSESAVDYGSDDYVAATSSPSPSPSEDEEDKDEEERVAERDQNDGGHVYRGSGDEVPEEEPTEEPSPTSSPTPTEEPTTEPSSEPSTVEEEPPE